MRRTFVLFSLLTLLLSACGFHLRGHNVNEKNYPFSSLFLKINTDTLFIADLKSNLVLNEIKLTETSATADLTLEIVSEATDKAILSVSGAGQVREFQLGYRVSLRAYDKQMQEWVPADEITIQRNLIYSDAEILAKEQEEALLYRDMRADAVQQVLRRLSRAKLRVAKTEQVAPALPPAPVKK